MGHFSSKMSKRGRVTVNGDRYRAMLNEFLFTKVEEEYYLWAAVKDKCYVDKPETIHALKENILEAIGKIQLHTIENVLKN